MSTYLDLCQHVHRYARIGQDAPGSAPTTVVGQAGVLAEIVGWVNDASEDIQRDQVDWRFRQKSGSVTVAAGTRDVDLSPIADYETLRPYTAGACRPFINRLDGGSSVPTSRVWVVPWAEWAGGPFDRGDSTGAPCVCTVTPAGMLRLYPTPAAQVVLQFDYQAVVQTLTADADVPVIPARHHLAIVWRALMYHADTRDSTKEEYQKWERRRKQAMQRLYRDQLPEITL